MRYVLIFCAVFLVGGCGVADRVGNRMSNSWAGDLFGNQERVRVVITSDASLNPDVQGEPLSVVVRLYQLGELPPFATAAPDRLWDDAEGVLGDSLISQRELTLLPGAERIDVAPLDERTRYVGIAAFFRHTGGNAWHVALNANELRRDGLISASEGIRVKLAGDRMELERGDDLINR
ncbi:type VI secretion system lipoprotein TssJ [Larsenimonas sp. GH3-8]|uniref:Type VI secretion system lipoprotein TssJ n=2 Tax=Larsenimonas rhizosphaerae TaxID=2944682 RepID=A0AA41ZKN3_9GAMM|nr:type VI secretion system lipoprotein TssJ [Larsenimonas rhizosphaerae]MCM2130794.1 type VI secretion system lipoprotein TssJ [Larsenimonas rhizosphaerae]MCX2523498.1 type VI secretion system lipoprotein TssJ [Larsenimonas rhizosphaerae]